MTDGGDRKDDRPDPFAPLPLGESLTGRSKTAPPSAPTPAPPAPAPPPLPPTAFTVASPAPPAPEPPLEPFGDVVPPSDATYAETQGMVYEPVPAFAGETAAVAEPPLLPPSYRENDLRTAVGATPRDEPTAKARKRRAATPPPVELDDDEGAGRPRSRKTAIVAALSLFLGCGIVAVIFIGRLNSGRFVIACEAKRMVVERGRAFPPWGTATLDDPAWKPLEIPPEAECHRRETEDTAELAGWYGKALVDQATAHLTAREVTKVDEAEAQLKQALLVARSLGTEDERTNARKDIERLLGDVGYWRASAKLRSASEALTAAAKEFDVAATQRPRHVTDAAAWATFVRKLVDDLKAGPAGAAQATFPPLPPDERPAAPPGVALPVEPGSGSGSAEPAPPPDAGVPTGGVLL